MASLQVQLISYEHSGLSEVLSIFYATSGTLNRPYDTQICNIKTATFWKEMFVTGIFECKCS